MSSQGNRRSTRSRNASEERCFIMQEGSSDDFSSLRTGEWSPGPVGKPLGILTSSLLGWHPYGTLTAWPSREVLEWHVDGVFLR